MEHSVCSEEERVEKGSGKEGSYVSEEPRREDVAHYDPSQEAHREAYS